MVLAVPQHLPQPIHLPAVDDMAWRCARVDPVVAENENPAGGRGELAQIASIRSARGGASVQTEDREGPADFFLRSMKVRNQQPSTMRPQSHPVPAMLQAAGTPRRDRGVS